MKLNKKDVAHIASFSDGAFKSWRDIMEEVKARRVEVDVAAIRQAGQSLGLSFD